MPKDKLANKIVAQILDQSLADSVWRRVYPGAYDNLLNLREDLERHVEELLRPI